MGILDQKSKFRVATPVVRKEVVLLDAPKPRPKPKPLGASPGPHGPRRPSTNGARGSRTPSSGSRHPSPAFRKSASPYPPTSDEKRRERKHKLNHAPHRPSPASDRVEFDKDSDTDDGWEEALDARKRRKRASDSADRQIDANRRLAHPALIAAAAPGAEAEEQAQELHMIHAAEVASLALKCTPVLGAQEDEVAVELQYPGSRQREHYELVWGKDKIDAVKDIKLVVKYVAENYLSDEESLPFLDQTSGLVRQLERASSDKVQDLKTFKSALDEFNSRLLALYKNGAIARNLSQKHDLPSHLIAFILDQVYDRTVAPKVELLRKYENGSDNVYGELLHPFVTNILVGRAKMTSDQVFVDLGSGVGNVVLQAALEVGCESWGCEVMENACNLAEAQNDEFAARCRLWGIAPGEVHLERGDFRCNTRVQEVLKRADVVLVNNQAFTSQLNDDLVRMFLDFKPGCKIISLKSFVHDHKSASYNINDVGSTILDVEDLTYPEGYVSWTGAAGTFCISTRK